MKELIKAYLKNELLIAKPKNTNIIFMDDLVLILAMQVYAVNDEYLDKLIEEIKGEIEYEVYIISRQTISTQWMTIKETPDNYFVLLDFLCCIINMKIRNVTNETWYSYLRYLEGVVTNEIIKNKKPLVTPRVLY